MFSSWLVAAMRCEDTIIALVKHCVKLSKENYHKAKCLLDCQRRNFRQKLHLMRVLLCYHAIKSIFIVHLPSYLPLGLAGCCTQSEWLYWYQTYHVKLHCFYTEGEAHSTNMTCASAFFYVLLEYHQTSMQMKLCKNIFFSSLFLKFFIQKENSYTQV